MLRFGETRRGEQAVTITADFAETWPELAPPERSVLLQSVIEGVYVKRANRPGKGLRVEDGARIVWAIGRLSGRSPALRLVVPGLQRVCVLR